MRETRHAFEQRAPQLVAAAQLVDETLQPSIQAILCPCSGIYPTICVLRFNLVEGLDTLQESSLKFAMTGPGGISGPNTSHTNNGI